MNLTTRCLSLVIMFSPGICAQTGLPTITQQPTSQTLNPGSNVALSVVATGATGYQWAKNGTPDSAVSATTATLSLSSVQASDSGSYYVVVSNSSGYVTSATVTLTVAVVSPPAITSASTATATTGSPFTFTISATGAPTSFGASGLPSGLSLNSTTGVISGTANGQLGTFSVSISATNAIGQTMGALLLTVAQPTVLYAYQAAIPGASLNPGAFTGPGSVAVNSSGVFCVADGGTDTIRDGSGSIIVGQKNLPGAADGSSALFFKPSGVAIDSSGTIYVSDTGNDTIRVINTARVVSTLAGSPQQVGSSDGNGSAARFNGPIGIAVDSQVNLYVADAGNQTIRKITKAGTVSTLAGSPGQPGNADGMGAGARFNLPSGVAVDNSGNVYVADKGNGSIRKITPAGATSTLATLNGVNSIAVDSSGNVFADSTGAFVEIPVGSNAVPLSGWHIANDLNLPSTVPYFLYPANAPPILANQTGLAVDAAGNLYWLNTDGTTGPGLALLEASPYVPVAITSAPVNQTVISGNLIQTAVATTGQPVITAVYGPDESEGNQLYLIPGATTSDTALIYEHGPGFYFSNSGTYEVVAYNVGSMATATFTVTVTIGPPVFESQPSSEAVVAGQSAIFNALASTTLDVPGAITYSWSFNGTPIPGANSPTYSIPNVQPANAGNYSATATLFLSGFGTTSAVSNAATLTINPAVGPQISVQPQSISVNAGSNATFSVTASGAPSPTYQWSLNGSPISGATSASYIVAGARSSNSGNYTVAVTNSAGTVISNGATLSVITPPSVTTAPQSQSVYAGSSAVLTVTTTGSAPTYQWQLNGAAIPGATGSSLVINNVQLTNAGAYSVVATNSAGTAISASATLSVITTRLANLSARGLVGAGANALIVGFVTSGASSKQLLIRGVGPTLANFGLTAVLANPQLTLIGSGGATIATDAGWGGTAALASAFAQVGAFALPSISVDSALLETLPGGAYTAQLSGAGTSSGVALAEIYDADVGTPASRLINISARGAVGTGPNILIAGFVISGNAPETVLLRGIGPTLASYGLSGVLVAPQLTLTDSSGNQLASNSGWGGTPILAASFTQVGAFSLSPTSADAALLITLPPGAYSAQLGGNNGTTGIGLVEVYEVQ